MRVTKPNWVEHTGEKKNKCPIYSISVHPDGTRLATGGLDHKVKIWSTLPILDQEAEADEANHRLLCTMSSHTGPVLAVRWAHHGRFLASGSDDQVVMVWHIDPNGGGRLWGSDEVNVENWKALRRLVGHVADVVDIAWSRDDSMLASVGLDSSVWIWDGFTFDRIKKIDVHQGFVKGVCWDPVGNFLATQSDDKTVKIWNTETWTLVESVGKPFERSPQSTFFRRLSWSPDGAFIAASNAMNGPVFVAAVIEREGWNADISFVGHENTIQVAAFNPCLFFRAGDVPGRATASCMVALGADDLSISIWRNTLHKPLVVLREIFGRQLLDLCWSNDGLHLYGCSADGTICAVTFEAEEFPELAHADMTKRVLDEYEYKPSRAPRSGSLAPSAQPYINGGPSPSRGLGGGTTEVVNILQVRKPKPGEPKRRVNLGLSSTGLTSAAPRRVQLNGAADAFAAAAGQPLASTSTASLSTAQMLQGAHTAFTNGHHTREESDTLSPRAGGKRKASVDDELSRPAKGRAMAGARPRVLGDIKEIRAARAPIAESSASGGRSGRTLPINKIQSVLRSKLEGSGDAVYLEVENAADEAGVNKLVYVRDGQDRWIDFLPCAVLVMTITSACAAVACEDGSVLVYSPAGRHLASMKLDSPCYDLTGNKDALLLVTANCHIQVFNVRLNKSITPLTSFSHLLDPTIPSKPAHTVTSTAIRPNGVPVIITSNPSAYAFDPKTSTWTPVGSSIYLTGSPLSSKILGRNHIPSGPVGEIEQALMETLRKEPVTQRSKWWNEALIMGHYEERLRACELLDSAVEYKLWLLLYAKYLGDGDWRGRAEELIKDLMGPVYAHPSTSSPWSPTILGMSRRGLLKEVLSTMRNTISLKEMATRYQDRLKEIASEQAELEG